MSFLEIADLAEATSFRRRLVPCVATAAGGVLQETPSGKYQVDMKRQQLARDALRDPVTIANQFVWGVISNPVIGAAGLDAEDGDLQYQVSQMWSTIAGVTAADEAEETP